MPVSQLPKKARREFETARKILRARYDAAQTNDHNAAHWAMADALSARAAHNAGVRAVLRKRSRYEVENNSWLSGIASTITHHTIGIGPRVQILHPNQEACLRVEREFRKWAKAVQFATKLHTMKESWVKTGDEFALLIRNKNLFPIQLDFRLYESEQCASPYADFDPRNDDGVHLDAVGEEDACYLLDNHPGDTQFYSPTPLGQWHEARNVIHYFHKKRPGQTRGVPPLTPSLELAPILRRMTKAALKAMETAASHSSVVRTTATGVEAADSPQDFASIELEHGMHTILPEGWDITQFDAKHPNSTYEMVVRVILNEIARPLSMPYNIAACNSAGYNYSSGRLDHQTYYKSIEVDQALIESSVLDKIFRAWLDEAVFVKGLLDDLPPISELEWQWCWDAQPVIDEATDAAASTSRIQSLQSTLPLEWQRRGYGDFESQLTKGAKAIGLTLEQYQRLWQFKNFGTTVDLLPQPVKPVQGELIAPDAAGASVQATALNGAQIAGILSITTQVVTGQLPVDAAEALINAAFPLLEDDQVSAILSPLKTFKPPLLADGTPNPALAVNATEIDGTPAASLGVSNGTKRRDFTNNKKAIRDVLNDFMAGESEAITKVSLGRLGLTPEDIQSLIDDVRDGKIDSLESDTVEVPA